MLLLEKKEGYDPHLYIAISKKKRETHVEYSFRQNSFKMHFTYKATLFSLIFGPNIIHFLKFCYFFFDK